MGMASEKSETFMHASTSVTTSAILRSHVGVVFAILGGVAFLIIVTAIAAHIYLRVRSKISKKQQECPTELGQRQTSTTSLGIIIPLTKVKTNTSESNQCGNTLSHHLGDGHHRYGMVEFGGFDAESIEPIKRDSGAFLPGDVVIPDISALTARKIRDTSAELTPPTTPERPRLTAIYHWYRPKEDPIASENTPEISSVEQEILAAAPDPLCVPYRHRLPLEYNKELPFPPNNGSEQDSTYSKRLGSQSVPAESQFGSMNLYNNRSARTSTLQRPQAHKLRKFGELENQGQKGALERRCRSQEADRARVSEVLSVHTCHSYETVKPGSHLGTVNAEQQERENGGYRLSIISAYREEPQDTQQDGEEQDTEMFLWKPLPRPPMERDWNKSAAAMV